MCGYIFLSALDEGNSYKKSKYVKKIQYQQNAKKNIFRESNYSTIFPTPFYNEIIFNHVT